MHHCYHCLVAPNLGGAHYHISYASSVVLTLAILALPQAQTVTELPQHQREWPPQTDRH